MRPAPSAPPVASTGLRVRASARSFARALGATALGALLFASAPGCRYEEALDPAITSLGVLPIATAPSAPGSGMAAANSLTGALGGQGFRLVGPDSAARLLAGPEGQDLYGRFRDQATGMGYASPRLATAIAQRLNVNALVLGQMTVRMTGPVDGRVGLTVGIYEGWSGRRVWQSARERNFRGVVGDAAFSRTVHEMAVDLGTSVPRRGMAED